MKNNIVYIADINSDIDDILAIEYLKLSGYLRCVVLDINSVNTNLISPLINLGVKFKESIPEDTTIIFNGGSLILVSNFIENHKLDLLMVSGGFAGNNMVPEKYQSSMFIGKQFYKSSNFNYDIDSTFNVLTSSNINKIIVVSKNTGKDDRNILNVIHNDDFIKMHTLSPTNKKLHNLLMVKEGINFISNNSTLCQYVKAEMICNHDIPKISSTWGAFISENSKILISLFIKG